MSTLSFAFIFKDNTELQKFYISMNKTSDFSECCFFLQKNSWMILDSKHPKGDILFTKDLVITSL